jgi:hypothetical protein
MTVPKTADKQVSSRDQDAPALMPSLGWRALALKPSKCRRLRRSSPVKSYTRLRTGFAESPIPRGLIPAQPRNDNSPVCRQKDIASEALRTRLSRHDQACGIKSEQGARHLGADSSFKINLLSCRSQQNLRCSKSNAIFQN